MSQCQSNARTTYIGHLCPKLLQENVKVSEQRHQTAVVADVMTVVATAAPMSVARVIKATLTTIAVAYFSGGGSCMNNSSAYSSMFKEPIPLKICLTFLSLFSTATDVISNEVSQSVALCIHSLVAIAEYNDFRRNRPNQVTVNQTQWHQVTRS